jgi:hypothetical protein
LFHAAGTPGVFPFRAFPLLKAVMPLDTHCPLDLSAQLRPARHGKPCVPAPSLFGGLQGFTPSASPFTRCRRLNQTTGPLLSWVSSSSRVSHDPRWVRLHEPSSLALQPRFASPASRFDSPRPGAPECCSTHRVAGLSLFPKKGGKTAVLHEVSSLVTLHIYLKSASPWLMVSPRAPDYVTASRTTFFGRRSLRLT